MANKNQFFSLDLPIRILITAKDSKQKFSSQILTNIRIKKNHRYAWEQDR